MRLQPMRYGDYVWPVNPEQVSVEYGKNVREVDRPYSESVLQNLGGRMRAVKGKGEFFGPQCAQEFGRLAAAFASEGAGMLSLPGLPPFPAVFASLKMTGIPQPDCVGYEFLFLEDKSGDRPAAGIGEGVYVCIGGEDFWSIANAYRTTADELRMLNPMIQWPNDLKAGQKVVLP